jgi:hypothetical protein
MCCRNLSNSPVSDDSRYRHGNVGANHCTRYPVLATMDSLIVLPVLYSETLNRWLKACDRTPLGEWYGSGATLCKLLQRLSDHS